jgi:hypothetical protein
MNTRVCWPQTKQSRQFSNDGRQVKGRKEADAFSRPLAGNVFLIQSVALVFLSFVGIIKINLQRLFIGEQVMIASCKRSSLPPRIIYIALN